MAREGEKRSHIRRRKKGCLTGCLTNILLVLGVAAAIFVGAHVLGFVKTDSTTGAPIISFDHIGLENLPEIKLDGIKLPDLSGWTKQLPQWAYHVESSGLTVKTLRAGDGEAVLVCADGYTLLLGAGSGSGVTLCAQTLLSGVNRLSAAVAMSAEDAQLGGMSAAMTLFKPEYLFVQNTQTKGKAYARMMDTAEKQGVKLVTADQGLAFTLGRATVTFIGPARKQHTDSRDDGLSLRIDYGGTSVVVMGGITSAGEKEIASSGANVKCSALIAARGGSDAGTCLELVSAAQPQIAFLTGKEPANSVRIRLQKAGVQVYAAKENGVMTLYSDGQTLTVTP